MYVCVRVHVRVLYLYRLKLNGEPSCIESGSEHHTKHMYQSHYLSNFQLVNKIKYHHFSLKKSLKINYNTPTDSIVESYLAKVVLWYNLEN